MGGRAIFQIDWRQIIQSFVDVEKCFKLDSFVNWQPGNRVSQKKLYTFEMAVELKIYDSGVKGLDVFWSKRFRCMDRLWIQLSYDTKKSANNSCLGEHCSLRNK